MKKSVVEIENFCVDHRS